MRLLVILPFLFSFFAVSAQNFQTYRPGSRAFYERNDTLFTVYARSVEVGQGNDTIYHFPNPWRKSADSACDLKRRGDFFLGREMIKKSYTNHCYVNRWGDTLRFHVDVHASIGSSYILMENDSLRFRAVYESLTYEVDTPILGVIQNLITQRIEVEDLSGTPVAHPFSGKRFGVTQFFGFYEIFNIYNFPTDTETYILKGSSVPFEEVDVRGLYPNTVFDIRPGYERHYVENYTQVGQAIRQRKYTLLTLSRTDRNDSLFLSHRRAVLDKDFIGQDSIFRIDTVNEMIPLQAFRFLEASEGEASLFGVAIPLDSFFRVSHEGLFYDSLPRYQETVSSIFQQEFPNQNCLIKVMDADSMIFAENLGRIFWQHEMGDTAIELRLRYFKRGIQSWGRPIDFSQFNGIEDHQIEVRIGPNPFRSEMKIVFPVTGVERQILIRDISGRIIFQGKGWDNFRIPTANWPGGIYLLEIREANRSGSRIIIKGQ